VKCKFKQMTGTRFLVIDSYLDEHMWRQRYSRNGRQAMAYMMQHVAERYPV